MKKQGVIVSAIVWSISSLTAAWGADPPKIDIDFGVPEWPSGNGMPAQPPPMILNIWVPGGLVPVPIPIKDLTPFVYDYPAFVRPVRGDANHPGETQAQFEQRLQTESAEYYKNRLKDTFTNAQKRKKWEDASKDKAEKIMRAINRRPGTGGLGPDRAVATQVPQDWADNLGVQGPLLVQFGHVTIKNATKWNHGLNSNMCGEGGDSGKAVRPAAAPGDMVLPNKESMGTPRRPEKSAGGTVAGGNPPGVGSALGVDPSGGPSVVELGIVDRYVATYYPMPGDTKENVLLALKALLDANGLPATYDSSQEVLTLDDDFGDSDTAYWSMTDMGLDGHLGFSYGFIIPPAAPTMTEWGVGVLMIFAITGIAIKFGRRRIERSV